MRPLLLYSDCYNRSSVKIVAEGIVDEQEQEETDQDGNNPANNPFECSDGARFVTLAHVNGDLQHCV